MTGIESETIAKLNLRFSRTRFIYFAQAGFVFTVAIAGWLAIPSSNPTRNAEALLSIWAFVFTLAIAAIIGRRFLFKWDRLRNIALLKGIDGLLAALQTNSIILAAVAEAIVLAGFAAAYTGGDRGDLVRSAIIAFIVLALNFPRISVWKTIVASFKDISE